MLKLDRVAQIGQPGRDLRKENNRQNRDQQHDPVGYGALEDFPRREVFFVAHRRFHGKDQYAERRRQQAGFNGDDADDTTASY